MVTQEEMQNMSPEEIRELQKQNCPFCKIIKGEIPANKVYEDDDVLAITDINPATKGHLLILPKEHYPILPLVPPEIFDKLFGATKLLSEAVKKALLVNSTTVFIANGGLAGQQSPHFLFHLLPRDQNDNLTNFTINGSNVDQTNIIQPLKHNLPIMMANQLKQRGIQAASSEQQPTSNEQTPDNRSPNSASPPSPEQLEQKRALIAKILEENADVRNLLKSDPEKFKETIEQNEELKNIFFGVDLEALSNHLRQYEEPKEQPVQEESPQEPEQPAVSAYANQSSDPSPQSTENGSQTSESSPKPEVFLGANPYEQKKRVFDYFETKPKAKELLMQEPQTFKELLSQRPDIQPIFENVNIEKLAKKLNEVEDHD